MHMLVHIPKRLGNKEQMAPALALNGAQAHQTAVQLAACRPRAGAGFLPARAAL